ncbi:MAG: branched-chain amino acid ABC transporter permease [Promethearchaeota archaeon]|jgi:branched-chain amino acid transport system permease protein
MTRKIQKKLSGLPRYLKDWITTFKGGVTIVCLLVLFLVPFLTQNEFYLEILILAMIYSIFAASWDFLAGFTGQVSFGHAIFLGLSGYAVSAMLVEFPFSPFVPWWGALLVGILISLVVGFIVGVICLRLKGPYLALGTMTIGVMLMNLFRIAQFKAFLWGDEGISGVPALSEDSTVVYIVVLIFMIISMITMIQISKSNTGTIMKSIRDDETGSEASGINTTKYKVIAFMISSFFAGLAGGLLAMYNRSINPLIFQPLFSFLVLVMAAMGGIATISGSALGAFIYILLSEALRNLEELGTTNPLIHALSDPSFVFSIILILIIRFASEGILKSALERLKNFWDVLLGR